MKPKTFALPGLLIALFLTASCSKHAGEPAYESAEGLRVDEFYKDIYGLPNVVTAQYASGGRLQRLQHRADPSVGGFVGSEISYSGNRILIRYVYPYPVNTPGVILSGELKADTVILTLAPSGLVAQRIHYAHRANVFNWDTVARSSLSDTTDYSYDANGFLTQSTASFHYRTWERGWATPRTTSRLGEHIVTHAYSAGLLTQSDFEQTEFNQDSASTINTRTTGTTRYGYGSRYRNAFDYSSAVLTSEVELGFPGFPLNKNLLYLPDTETTVTTSQVLPSGAPATATATRQAVYTYQRNGLVETAWFGSNAQNRFTYRKL